MTTQTEQERRRSNTAKLLAYLKLNGSGTNRELTRVAGMRFSSRLLETIRTMNS